MKILKRIDCVVKAEEILQDQNNPIMSKSKDFDELIHNLRVHQIELEIQNEELQEAQLKLEESDINILIFTILCQMDILH